MSERETQVRRSEPCQYCEGSGVVEQERNFLLERTLHGDSSWVGVSSTAMTMWAITGQAADPARWPHDKWDLGRCEETYRRAPEHLRQEMLPILERFRRHVAEGSLYCRGCDNSIDHHHTRRNLCDSCWEKANV